MGILIKGDSVATVYLLSEMNALKLVGFESNFYLPYATDINTFIQDSIFKMGDKQLEFEQDFIVYPNSRSCKVLLKSFG